MSAKTGKDRIQLGTFIPANLAGESLTDSGLHAADLYLAPLTR